MDPSTLSASHKAESGVAVGALHNRVPSAARQVSENNPPISNPKVSPRLAAPSPWTNSRRQDSLRSKLGYALSCRERGVEREAASAFLQSFSHEILGEYSLDFSAWHKHPVWADSCLFLHTVPRHNSRRPWNTRVHRRPPVSQRPSTPGGPPF